MQDKQNIEKYLLDKIDKGEDLNNSEREKLVTTFSRPSEENPNKSEPKPLVPISLHTLETFGFSDDGYRDMGCIVKLSNRYFYQEYEIKIIEGNFIDSKWYRFYGQPIEVHPEIRTEKHERWVTSSGEELL